MAKRVEADINANYKPIEWMRSLEMSLGLQIRSKVNRVQNYTNIDKTLLSISDSN